MSIRICYPAPVTTRLAEYRAKLDCSNKAYLDHLSSTQNYRFNVSVPKMYRSTGSVSSSDVLMVRTSQQLSQRSNEANSDSIQTYCAELFGSQWASLGHPESPDRCLKGLGVDRIRSRVTYDPTMFHEPINAHESLKLAKESSICSKNLVRFLQLSSSNGDKEGIATLVEKDLSTCISNENFCNLLKYLTKVNERVREAAADFATHNLATMLAEIHSSRLLFSLCDLSESFRNGLRSKCQTQLEVMLSSLQGAILLSLLISRTDNMANFRFMIKAVCDKPHLIGLKYFGRAFSFYMFRCSDGDLEKLARVFKNHVLHLMNDNYGNFLLQIFYDRNCLYGMQMCQEALKTSTKKALIRKYCRYVLYKAILNDTNGGLSIQLVLSACSSIKFLQVVLSQRQPTAILLLALSKIREKHLRESYAQSILRMGHDIDARVRNILKTIVSM